MNAPRCLIAEDEPLLAAGLRADLAAIWPELQVVATVGDGRSAAAQTLALRPDVCFFDIRMPGASGMEAAQALAEDWPDAHDGVAFPLLVFVTAYDDYALQAFEAQAVDYLVKPVDRPRLAACVARLKTRLQARAADTAGPEQALQAAVAQLQALLGHTGVNGMNGMTGATGVLGVTGSTGNAGTTGSAGGQTAGQASPAEAPRLHVIQAQVGNLVHLVPVADVVYFEAADKYVRVITPEREHLIRASLRELLPQLDPAMFWQVHRGTVVQAARIATARREESGKVTLTLRGRPETITVSRLYAHLFKGM